MSHWEQTNKDLDRESERENKSTWNSRLLPKDPVGFRRGTNQHKNQQFMANACTWVASGRGGNGAKQLPWPFTLSSCCHFSRRPFKNMTNFSSGLCRSLQKCLAIYLHFLFISLSLLAAPNRRHLSLPAPLVACPCCLLKQCGLC